MALKIRMRKQGRTNRPFYRIVLTDSKSPRDGKYIEELGWYSPMESDEARILHLCPERITHWLTQGAILTEKVESLVKKAHPEVIRSLKERVMARRAKDKERREKRSAVAARG